MPEEVDKMSEEEALTVEDLRDRLYNSLRQTGAVDSLKSQLRNRLVGELKKLGVKEQLVAAPVSSSGNGSLLLTATNSLVADHLRRCHYDYSLSVFLPECALSESKIFTTKDLLQLLKISPQSSLYKNLALHSGKSYHETGFLWQLLLEIASLHGQSCLDSGVQTDEIGLPPLHSLHEKLKLVDDYYTAHGESHASQLASIQERMLSYQHMVDQRSQSEVKLQVARFKDTELARIRMEEKERFREQLETARRDMERDFRVKYDGLLERERNSMERLQKQQELSEKDIYTQRQSILSEIESVRQREIELRRQQEILEREKMMYEDRNKTKEEGLRRRDDAVRKAEMEYESRLHADMAKFQLETQSAYMQRYKDLEWREIKAKEDSRRLEEELMEIKKVKDELREKRMRVNELEAEVEKCRRDMLTSQHQADMLSHKARQMVDYQSLKEENVLIKQELNQTKKLLAECQRDLNLERQRYEDLLLEIGERQNRPTAEVLILKRELEKARTQLKQEQVVSDHMRAQLDTKFLDEKSRREDMVQRFEAQTYQHFEMNQEMEMLRKQLASTRQALTNEVYQRNGTQVTPVTPQRLASFGPVGIYDQPWHKYDPNSSKPDNRTKLRGESPTQSDIDEMLTTPTKKRTKDISSSDTDIIVSKSEDDTTGVSQSEEYSYSTDIVKDTRHRLKNLEREAESLEENYRNFQFRMTNVHAAIPMSPPKTYHYSSGEERSPIVKEKLSTPFRTSLLKSQQLSSTPQKLTSGHIMQDRGITKPTNMASPQLNLSVSSVNTTPDRPKTSVSRDILERKDLKIDDLRMRSDSPPVVIFPASEASKASVSLKGEVSSVPNQTHTETFPERRSPPGESEVSEDIAPPPAGPLPVSLDSAWTANKGEDGPAKWREEQEERREEEMRLQREEERRRREEEAWEREQQELHRLRGEGTQEMHNGDVKLDSQQADTAQEPQIDPVMQKYMDMLKQQKDREQEVAQKAVNLWPKGKLKENAEAESDDEISAGIEKSESQASQGKHSDAIFDDW